VALELCSALGHAHGRGVIHRALKPENVFLDRGRLVLTDFGIVKAFDVNSPLGAEAARPVTAVVGIPGFIAPEQLAQRSLDGRTDIFALGVLLYFLATKRLPYEAESRSALAEQFLHGKPPPIQSLRPGLSNDFALLVHRCLETATDRRPESATLLRHAMQRMLERRGHRDAREILTAYGRDPRLEELAWGPVESTDTAENPMLQLPPAGRRRRRLGIVLGLAVLAALGAVVAWWAGVTPTVIREVLKLH
jgi:serine/threonine protein kinase